VKKRNTVKTIGTDQTNNMTNEPVYHTPALLSETIDGLKIKPDGIYVDVTFGGGGHEAGDRKATERKRAIVGL